MNSATASFVVMIVTAVGVVCLLIGIGLGIHLYEDLFGGRGDPDEL
jgi:hypothetical protein